MPHYCQSLFSLHFPIPSSFLFLMWNGCLVFQRCPDDHWWHQGHHWRAGQRAADACHQRGASGQWAGHDLWEHKEGWCEFEEVLVSICVYFFSLFSWIGLSINGHRNRIVFNFHHANDADLWFIVHPVNVKTCVVGRLSSVTTRLPCDMPSVLPDVCKTLSWSLPSCVILMKTFCVWDTTPCRFVYWYMVFCCTPVT